MYEEAIRELDAAIAGVEPFDVAFDGFRLADSALFHAHAARLVGCELRDLGFLDLTLDPDVAIGYVRGDHPVLVRVTAPAGTRAAATFMTNDYGESDLLLARGTRSRVVSVEAPAARVPLCVHLEIVP